MAGKRKRAAARHSNVVAGKAAAAATTVSARLRRSETTAHDTYVVRVGDIHVVTTVTARPAVARPGGCAPRCGVTAAASAPAPGSPSAWGAVEAAVPRARRRRPGTLQLCVGRRCLVFQIARAAAANGVPAALQRFLADNGVAFVGYGVRSDCRKLAAHHEGVRVACTRELRSVTGMGNASMERMAEELLGLAGMKKPVTVSRSRWDAPKLSKKQVKYACVDAFLSLRLGVHVGVTPSSSSD
ncbi:uncharacterized protein LOC102715038 [Oryza brachyantha]|uniref:uncharacterized protein LOC102715038 n=1 Tax=Oryza brachyantha TaxID=4533 RepID=UPI001AD9BDC5|nr:uncharacterized protein LOC102715038 [Oryza brachyantha]